jgi:hypothetical protein
MTRIALNNHIEITINEWTMRTHWTPLHTGKKLINLSTNLCIFWNFRNRGVSTDYLVDSGQWSLTKCSFIIYNNSLIGILKLFSCVKSVLKIRQFNRIKKFYRCRGVSTLSTVSNIKWKRNMVINNLFTVMRNFYKNNNKKNNNNNNNNGKEKEEKEKNI